MLKISENNGTDAIDLVTHNQALSGLWVLLQLRNEHETDWLMQVLWLRVNKMITVD